MQFGKAENLWDDHLEEALFALRAHTHRSTGCSAIELLTGVVPRSFREEDYVRAFHRQVWSDDTMAQARAHRQQHLPDLRRFRDQALDRLQQAHEQDIGRSERRDNDTGFDLGDKVLKKVFSASKLQPTWSGPFIIARIAPNGAITLRTPAGHLQKTNTNHRHIKPYIDNPAAAARRIAQRRR